ncbi:hypothetical protein GH714_002922 [Hevea brasiliensis]|uniref:Auxin-responsive protein n=1 Tax=Hevea brasiliensis TaxID=3981 RepID=A0A6A6KIU2_HEVBR|nr:hypothetical protein GH714_002922 [Hevea brasiliensis]
MIFQRDGDLILVATVLRLGLSGTTEESEKQMLPTTTAKCNKRSLPGMNKESEGSRIDNYNVYDIEKKDDEGTSPPTKAQVVGWPPIRSYRRNCFQAMKIGLGLSSDLRYTHTKSIDTLNPD